VARDIKAKFEWQQAAAGMGKGGKTCWQGATAGRVQESAQLGMKGRGIVHGRGGGKNLVFPTEGGQFKKVKRQGAIGGKDSKTVVEDNKRGRNLKKCHLVIILWRNSISNFAALGKVSGPPGWKAKVGKRT